MSRQDHSEYRIVQAHLYSLTKRIYTLGTTKNITLLVDYVMSLFIFRSVSHLENRMVYKQHERQMFSFPSGVDDESSGHTEKVK